jgi:hypothetical protein
MVTVMNHGDKDFQKHTPRAAEFMSTAEAGSSDRNFHSFFILEINAMMVLFYQVIVFFSDF